VRGSAPGGATGGPGGGAAGGGRACGWGAGLCGGRPLPGGGCALPLPSGGGARGRPCPVSPLRRRLAAAARTRGVLRCSPREGPRAGQGKKGSGSAAGGRAGAPGPGPAGGRGPCSHATGPRRRVAPAGGPAVGPRRAAPGKGLPAQARASVVAPTSDGYPERAKPRTGGPGGAGGAGDVSGRRRAAGGRPRGGYPSAR
jgi:hypothetical protein